MSEPIVKHQLFDYNEQIPFQFLAVPGNAEDTSGVEGLLCNHWHEELEIAYGMMGHGHHYINGECIESQPGRLVVTNSEFIHSIIPDQSLRDCPEIASIVIIIHPRFLQENFPEYQHLYFTNERETASPGVQAVMQEIIAYMQQGEAETYGYLRGKSLVLMLLYEMCRQGVVERTSVDNVNHQKNIERMKGVFSFIENHYMEHIPQSYVAEKFYFSTVYFSRYFKRCTGLTYTEYLTDYRVQKARKDLLYTEKSISDIALDHGFSDDRRLILAFRKKYGTTPLQYRKSKKTGERQQ